MHNQKQTDAIRAELEANEKAKQPPLVVGIDGELVQEMLDGAKAKPEGHPRYVAIAKATEAILAAQFDVNAKHRAPK